MGANTFVNICRWFLVLFIPDIQDGLFMLQGDMADEFIKLKNGVQERDKNRTNRHMWERIQG